jgi:hypothetical protein
MELKMNSMRIGIISALVLIMAGSAFANQYVLEVGGQKYSTAELKAIMSENNFELPDQAIQKLQQDAVLKNSKKSGPELYEQFFGTSKKMDDARAKAKDLPVISQKAECRNYMFNMWLNEKARKVPVKYLDINVYWDMVKQTESYRVREESGRRQSSDQIAYTFAELLLPEEQKLATRNNTVFLSGSDYNGYVTENYNQIHAFAKRSKDVNSVRNYLIERVAGEKLLAENIALEVESLDEIEQEREIRGYVEANMLKEDLVFSGKEYLSPSDMQQDLYIAYNNKHAAKLVKIKKAIVGQIKLEELDNDARGYVVKRRLARMKKSISQGLNSSEVYSWMEDNKFPASFKDAQFVIANERYQKLMETSLKENGIKLNLLEK